MTIKHLAAAAVAAFSMLIGGCGGGGGGIGGTGSPAVPGSGVGTLNFKLTDAPACGYDAVNVTIEKVRVHQSASAGDGDAGWSEVVLNPARRVDLLTLTNGVLFDLGQTLLPAGKYTQLRLVLAANAKTPPYANSVVLSSSKAEVALDTPSAAQSGLKVNLDVDVPSDQVVDLVLDFDACKSVVRAGNSGKYLLKPVITATPVFAPAGMRVIGWVDPAIAMPSTVVSVQVNGVPVKATSPDFNIGAAGRFELFPVPAGQYDLVVSAAGRVTAVLTSVTVTTTEYTIVNGASAPIVPPPATARDVTGTITPATATVRATQALTGGPTVEVAWSAVDAVTGAFAFALPIEAPVRASFLTKPTVLNFVADAAVASKYTIEASSGGVVKPQVIDTSAAVAPLTFTFP
jgi:Domain of unknown function (DUF4382)